MNKINLHVTIINFLLSNFLCIKLKILQKVKIDVDLYLDSKIQTDNNDNNERK